MRYLKVKQYVKKWITIKEVKRNYTHSQIVKKKYIDKMDKMKI